MSYSLLIPVFLVPVCVAESGTVILIVHNMKMI